MKVLALSIAACLVLLARPAAAQSSKATAEALYREGQRLIGENKIGEACARFAESEAQDPVLATLVALAACHEKQGRTATAWGEYAEASTKPGPAGDFAKRRAAALEPTLARIHLDLSPIPDGFEVHVDDAAFGAGIVDADLPIDPGAHVIHATATNKQPWMTTVTIAANASITHVAIVFQDAPAPAPPAPLPIPAPPAPAPEGPDYQRPISLGVVGAGVVLFGVATYYEVNAVSDRNTYDSEKVHRINSRGDNWSDIASKAQVYAIVFGALGVAGVASGAVLFFTDKSGRRAALTPVVAPGYAGAGVGGTF